MNTKQHKSMLQTWRWFGPNDPIPLTHIRQAGVQGIVSSLHEIPNGEVWPIAEIMKRKSVIEEHEMTWAVVESIPVHKDIKKQKGDFHQYIDAYKQSIENLASCGITTVCYNFMPILDWTRTDLSYVTEDSSTALRFDATALAAFELFILKRPGAETFYSSDKIQKARSYFESLSVEQNQQLQSNIMAGLPGSEGGYSLSEFQRELDDFKDIDDKKYREHLYYFLRQIAPVAERVGVRLAIHPDDPPYSILGLPRVVSTEDDARRIIEVFDSPFNGLCFCTGSYGVRADNDLTGMIKRLGHRINFIHLRSTKCDADGNFFEANHLDGDVDMVAVIKALSEEQRRRPDKLSFRPDHGHVMLDDLGRKTNPGYSAIGRLRGLAELRGIEYGVLGMKS